MFLAHPNVFYILMLLAIYGILGELQNPGATFPGVIGAIALLLALYAASVLPVNALGVALILLAFVLFVAELFTTSHGVLTAARWSRSRLARLSCSSLIRLCFGSVSG